MIDLQKYYTRLASREAIPEAEIADLLKELSHFRGATAYLASCAAATLESLPKSAGRSARIRQVLICDNAAMLLDGDSSCINFGSDKNGDLAKKRCLAAVAECRGPVSTTPKRQNPSAHLTDPK